MTLHRAPADRGADEAAQPRPPASAHPRAFELARRVWNEASPVTADDEVGRYLRGNAIELEPWPKALRFHPRVPYFERSGSASHRVTDHAAMLACVQDGMGRGVNVHRTYLGDGDIAPVARPRKPMLPLAEGSAVRLQPPGLTLAVAVSIESALAIHVFTGFPAWATLSAANLRSFHVPEGVGLLAIYVTRDEAFLEQAAGHELAARLKRGEKGRSVEVDLFVSPELELSYAQLWAGARAAGMKTAQEKRRESAARWRHASQAAA